MKCSNGTETIAAKARRFALSVSAPDWNDRKGYLICGEPRSGSTYLSRLLASTGVLGAPREPFCGIPRVKEIKRHPVSQLVQWVETTSSPNGVYGFKVFSHQFDLIEPLDWPRILPNLHFIHLQRADILGQAISQVRADQTGCFERHQPEQGPSRYDRAAISRALRGIAFRQARWATWFARNGFTPLNLCYEQVISEPQRWVEAVAALVGVNSTVVADPAGVQMDVQRDELSDAWRARFVQDSHGTSFLDDFIPLAPLLRRWRARIF